MIELKADRLDQMLHAETGKKEELNTILRGLYTRYMTLYEKYFADIEALNDEEIASMKNYHSETRSLLRYYFLDVPQDICRCLIHFDEEYTDKLLGPEWHKYLFDNYKEFKEDYTGKNKSKQNLKAEFAKQTLEDFYDTMDYIFREAFGTGSKVEDGFLDGVKKLFFAEE